MPLRYPSRKPCRGVAPPWSFPADCSGFRLPVRGARMASSRGASTIHESAKIEGEGKISTCRRPELAASSHCRGVRLNEERAPDCTDFLLECGSRVSSGVREPLEERMRTH